MKRAWTSVTLALVSAAVVVAAYTLRGDTSDLEVGVGRGMTVTLTSRGHEIATFDEEDEIFLDAGILHRSLFLACSLFGGLPPLPRTPLHKDTP